MNMLGPYVEYDAGKKSDMRAFIKVGWSKQFSQLMQSLKQKQIYLSSTEN